MGTLTSKALEWLAARGMDAAELERFDLSVENRAGSDWLVIPYKLNGETVNRKYRRLDAKEFAQDKGGVKCFFNHDCLTDATLADQAVIITEGEFDAMAAMLAGFPRVVSVPDGAPAEALGDRQSEKYNYLNLKDFDGCREIILAVDNDAPGVNLLNDLAIRFGRERCKYVTYPKLRDGSRRCKDLNEVLLTYGAKGVTETIARAAWVQTDGVYRMEELPPINDAPGYPCPVEGLAERYILRKGDFVVLTGIPGHGKSSFMNDVACRMAARHGWRVAFASFEQLPQTDHLRNLRTWFLEKPVKYATDTEIAHADKWINDRFRFIVPSTDDFADLEWLVEKCAQSVVQHNCDMIVIDPWNEVDHCRERDESLTEYTGRAIKRLKKMAIKLNVHLVVAAHPAKMRRQDDGTYTPPNLYDVSDSQHWYNKADIGLTVHRPDPESDRTEVHVTKARYHTINGQIGMASLKYDFPRRTYSRG